MHHFVQRRTGAVLTDQRPIGVQMEPEPDRPPRHMLSGPLTINNRSTAGRSAPAAASAHERSRFDLTTLQDYQPQRDGRDDVTPYRRAGLPPTASLWGGRSSRADRRRVACDLPQVRTASRSTSRPAAGQRRRRLRPSRREPSPAKVSRFRNAQLGDARILRATLCERGRSHTQCTRRVGRRESCDPGVMATSPCPCISNSDRAARRADVA